MLYVSKGDEVIRRTDWDEESIKNLFIEMRENYRSEISGILAEIANSKDYKAHAVDFSWDLIDSVTLAEDADARRNCD